MVVAHHYRNHEGPGDAARHSGCSAAGSRSSGRPRRPCSRWRHIDQQTGRLGQNFCVIRYGCPPPPPPSTPQLSASQLRLKSPFVCLRWQNVVELTDKNFDDLVGQDRAVVLDFYAPCARRAARCPPRCALCSAPIFSRTTNLLKQGHVLHCDCAGCGHCKTLKPVSSSSAGCFELQLAPFCELAYRVCHC